jgi:hypothetical protein
MTDAIAPLAEPTAIDTTTPDLSWAMDLTAQTEPQGSPQFAAAAPGILRLGLDTIDPAALHGLQFYWLAGYVGGHWPDFHPMVQSYPQLAKAGRIFSYAVNSSEDADFCDCEAGDLSSAEVPGWLARQFARGAKRPGVYASWDEWANQGLLGDLAHYGKNIRRIVAHYTFVPQISHQGFDCQQYTDHYASRNIDGNVALDSFFETTTPAVNSLHYDWFPIGPFSSPHWGKLNERLIVEEYDGARQHPDKYKTYIPLLEAKLKWLADRIAWLAIYGEPQKNGKPDWSPSHRGWRYQHLIHRAHGMQFAA